LWSAWKTSSPPTIQNISNPRKASSEVSRRESAEPGVGVDAGVDREAGTEPLAASLISKAQITKRIEAEFGFPVHCRVAAVLTTS
jgi:hypothetical protein